MTPSIRLHTRATVRTGRYAVIGAEPAEARRVWIALHGYGQLAPRFLRPFDGVVPADTCVVAPEGLSRFYREMPKVDGSHLQKTGATWMTREQREDDIADTMRWLDVLYDDIVGPRELEAFGVLGFSQGVATATRWLASRHLRPDAFVVWAGELAKDVDRSRLTSHLAQTAVTLVAGERDQFVSAESRAHALAEIRAWHPAARGVTFDGEHHLDAAVLRDLLHDLARGEQRDTGHG
jgi:predicted esterase